jgi:hypothetical protein
MSPASAPVFRRRLSSRSRIVASGNANTSPPMLLPQLCAPRGSSVCPWIPRRLGSTPLCPGHHLLLARQAGEDKVPPLYHDYDIEAPPLQQLPPLRHRASKIRSCNPTPFHTNPNFSSAFSLGP